MDEVIIIGCGPAGLLAAHAAEQLGVTPVIISRKVKSVIPGSQYLHNAIPGLTSPYPDNTVLYTRIGTAAGYGQKVYGDPNRETGWRNYATVYPSWNVHQAYDNLWFRYADRIEDTVENLEPAQISWLLDSNEMVISTVPAQHACYDKSHDFKGANYWIQTLPTPPEDEGRDVVVYNGILRDQWYRWSILGGVCSIEYAVSPPLSFTEDSVVKGIKAVSTDCDCHPGLVRAGRWAEWRHGVLLNDAYTTAYNAIKEKI